MIHLVNRDTPTLLRLSSCEASQPADYLGVGLSVDDGRVWVGYFKASLRLVGLIYSSSCNSGFSRS